MAGSVNKVILIGNLGKDPEVRRLNSGDQVVSFSRRHLGVLARQDHRRAQGAHRVAQHRDLQREPRQDRRAVLQEGLARSTSRASCRPANGRTRAATTAIRPRSCCSASAANCSCSTSRGGGEARDSFPDDKAARAASAAPPPATAAPALSGDAGGGAGPIDDDIPF